LNAYFAFMRKGVMTLHPPIKERKVVQEQVYFSVP
jgi:hypothetical protein